MVFVLLTGSVKNRYVSAINEHRLHEGCQIAKNFEGKLGIQSLDMKPVDDLQSVFALQTRVRKGQTVIKNSSVSRRLAAGLTGLLFPAGARILLLQTGCGAQLPIQCVLGLTRPGPQVDQSPPSSSVLSMHGTVPPLFHTSP